MKAPRASAFWKGLITTAIVLSAMLVPVTSAYALYGDTRFEVGSGYEGTYEWRGACAYTYVYDWRVPNGRHVSSLFIAHPNGPFFNYKHMEVGVARRYTWTPEVFIQWCETVDGSGFKGPYYIDTVNIGTTQKLLIKNMTMGNVNTGPSAGLCRSTTQSSSIGITS